MTNYEISEEFERQVKNLIQKDYPKAAGLSIAQFLKLIEPLKKKLAGLKLPQVNLETGVIPFVLVIQRNLVPSEKAMELLEFNNKPGITKLHPLEPADFTTIGSISIPDSPIYLLVDIDRGKETLNVRPQDALKIITKQNRSPLTIDEGIAIITQFPEFLIKNNCFSLLASRHIGDQRVPAIWINASKQANLGWCWDGNPHTWLGSASAGTRIG